MKFKTIRTRPAKMLLATVALSLICEAAFAAAQELPSGFRQATQRVQGGGVVHYVRGGKGEPILLVHGFGETARMWRPLLPILAKRFTVIVPDLPGLAGSSPMPSGIYDMKAVSQRLHDFVRRLGFRHTALVGHDIGLMAVYAYAAQYPSEVTKMALMDAPIPGIGEVWPKVFNDPALWHFHFPNSPIALQLVKGRERIFLNHFWISFSGNPNAVAIPEAERRRYAELYAQPGVMRAALGYFKAFPTDALENEALEKKGKLTMPILTIEGEHSMNGALKTQANEVAVNVRSVILKGAGHWLMEERRVAVETELTKFLGEATSTATNLRTRSPLMYSLAE